MLHLLIFSLLGLAVVAPGQNPKRPCENMAYENRNQTDYGALRLSTVAGTAKDAQGVAIPSVCVGIFTESNHELVAAALADNKGRFELRNIPPGDYRLVAKSEGFCPANARIRIERAAAKNGSPC